MNAYMHIYVNINVYIYICMFVISICACVCIYTHTCPTHTQYFCDEMGRGRRMVELYELVQARIFKEKTSTQCSVVICSMYWPLTV